MGKIPALLAALFLASPASAQIVLPGGSTSSGGTGTPGGTNGQIQFNNSGSFGGLTPAIQTGCQATGGTIGNSLQGTISTQELPNSQTGANYAIVTGDCGKLDLLSNAGAQTPTIAAAGSAGFPNGWYVDLNNTGAGTQTFTPTTSTINGNATQVLRQGEGIRNVSDGTNYQIGFFSVNPAFSHTWGGTQTLNNLTVNGTCTGCAGSSTITAGTTATSGITSGNLIGSTSNLVVDSLVPIANFPVSSTVNGDIATFSNTTGKFQDSGTLLSSLAPLASPTFTGTVSAAAVTSSAAITSSATGAAGAPNFIGSAAGATTGFYFPAVAGEMGFSSSGTVKGDYGITNASAWTFGSNVFINGSIAGAASSTLFVSAAALQGVTLRSLTTSTANSAAGTVNITGGSNTAASGTNNTGGSINITAGASTGAGAGSNGGNIALTLGTSTNGTAGRFSINGSNGVTCSGALTVIASITITNGIITAATGTGGTCS